MKLLTVSRRKKQPPLPRPGCRREFFEKELNNLTNPKRSQARGRGAYPGLPAADAQPMARYYGHEFQTKFNWHVEDLGMRHDYIKPRTPRLNCKVERSHGTDQQEFYRLLTYTGDVDLNAKLAESENYHNHHRPHGSLGGKTPYEILREQLQ